MLKDLSEEVKTNEAMSTKGHIELIHHSDFTQTFLSFNLDRSWVPRICRITFRIPYPSHTKRRGLKINPKITSSMLINTWHKKWTQTTSDPICDKFVGVWDVVYFWGTANFCVNTLKALVPGMCPSTRWVALSHPWHAVGKSVFEPFRGYVKYSIYQERNGQTCNEWQWMIESSVFSRFIFWGNSWKAWWTSRSSLGSSCLNPWPQAVSRWTPVKTRVDPTWADSQRETENVAVFWNILEKKKGSGGMIRVTAYEKGFICLDFLVRCQIHTPTNFTSSVRWTIRYCRLHVFSKTCDFLVSCVTKAN